jgi:hypothetical protein
LENLEHEGLLRAVGNFLQEEHFEVFILLLEDTHELLIEQVVLHHLVDLRHELLVLNLRSLQWGLLLQHLIFLLIVVEPLSSLLPSALVLDNLNEILSLNW